MTKKKPAKPYPDFPLFAHASGQWAKKIRYKTHYFGPWENWKQALDKYVAERDLLQLGKQPNQSSDRLTLQLLCNQFLHNRRLAADRGEITERSWKDYESTAKRLCDHLGRPMRVDLLTPDDFGKYREHLAKTRSPAAMVGEIARVRAIFNFGIKHGLMTKVAWGDSFKKPSSVVLRKEKATKGKKLFTRAELLAIMAACSPTLKAMVLLAINCGVGNMDCAKIRWDNLDLDRGWMDFPRPKTGVERRAKLWPETIAAIKAIPRRSEELVFLTKFRNNWANDLTGSAISKEFAKVLETCKIHREGLGFYSIRRTFQTVADDCGDFLAVAHVMGHVDQSMSGVYRQSINAKRLETVASHVWGWLYGEAESDGNRSSVLP